MGWLATVKQHRHGGYAIASPKFCSVALRKTSPYLGPLYAINQRE
jgi:hypothetical protein